MDTAIVVLDIGSAYEVIWHALLFKSQVMGIQGGFLRLSTVYLYGRTLQVVVNEQFFRYLSVEASVPQVSVLGPILWNIYMNDLLQLLPTTSAYADDCSLFRLYYRQDR